MRPSLVLVATLLFSSLALLQPAAARSVQIGYVNAAALFNACEAAGGVFFDEGGTGHGVFKCITQCRDSNGDWKSCSVTCDAATRTCEGWVPDRRALQTLSPHFDFRSSPPAAESLSDGAGGSGGPADTGGRDNSGAIIY